MRAMHPYCRVMVVYLDTLGQKKAASDDSALEWDRRFKEMGIKPPHHWLLLPEIWMNTLYIIFGRPINDSALFIEN